MANTKISGLTAGVAVTATDLFPAVETVGVGPVKKTAAQLADFVGMNLGAATGTSLALGGATLGSNALAVTGTGVFSGLLQSAASVTTGSGATYMGLNSGSDVTLFSNAYSGSSGAGIAVQSTGQYSFSSTTNATAAADVKLFRDAAGILAQRNGANAQTSRVYNTFTDASNGEWGEIGWASNVLSIGTKANGTGAARNLQFVVGGVSKLDYGVTVANTISMLGGSNPFQVANNGVNVVVTAAGTGSLLFAVGGNYSFGIMNTPHRSVSMPNDGLYAWSSDGGPQDTQDAAFSRISAGVIGVGTGAQGSTAGTLKAAVVATPGTTVSSLPAAATAGAGARAFVTDATASTFGTAVTGGGSNAVPVWTDGTTWKIG